MAGVIQCGKLSRGSPVRIRPGTPLYDAQSILALSIVIMTTGIASPMITALAIRWGCFFVEILVNAVNIWYILRMECGD